MNYWLLKSEPTTFSITDLSHCVDQTDSWEGVRNYQARNMLRDQIQVDDLAFFYHSSTSIPGIVGIVKIVRSGYPDDSACDPHSPYYDPKFLPDQPRWYCVDVKLVEIWSEMIPLHALKQLPYWQHVALTQRGNRLSVMPIPCTAWNQAVLLAKHLTKNGK